MVRGNEGEGRRRRKGKGGGRTRFVRVMGSTLHPPKERSKKHTVADSFRSASISAWAATCFHSGETPEKNEKQGQREEGRER